MPRSMSTAAGQPARSLAVDRVDLAAVDAGVGRTVGQRDADDEVAIPVAVVIRDVDPRAGVVAGFLAPDRDVGARRQVEVLAHRGTRAAPHDAGFAALRPRVERAGAVRDADDDVVEPVTVEIAEGDRAAGQVDRVDAVDERDRAEIDRATLGTGTAPEEVEAAARVACVRRAVHARAADGELVDAVAVDVTGGQRDARVVARVGAVDDHVALRDVRDAGPRGTRAAVEDVDVAAVGADVARPVGQRGRHRDVVEAVAVEVAGHDEHADLVAGVGALDADVGLRQEVLRRAEVHARVPPDDVHGARVRNGLTAPVDADRTDDDVAEPVAVQVAKATARPALSLGTSDPDDETGIGAQIDVDRGRSRGKPGEQCGGQESENGGYGSSRTPPQEGAHLGHGWPIGSVLLDTTMRGRNMSGKARRPGRASLLSIGVSKDRVPKRRIQESMRHTFGSGKTLHP